MPGTGSHIVRPKGSWSQGWDLNNRTTGTPNEIVGATAGSPITTGRFGARSARTTVRTARPGGSSHTLTRLSLERRRLGQLLRLLPEPVPVARTLERWRPDRRGHGAEAQGGLRIGGLGQLRSARRVPAPSPNIRRRAAVSGSPSADRRGVPHRALVCACLRRCPPRDNRHRGARRGHALFTPCWR